MPVIPVNKVVDPKRIIGKKMRAKEEERHKRSMTQKNVTIIPGPIFVGRSLNRRHGKMSVNA
jgi:hypothetical protein